MTAAEAGPHQSARGTRIPALTLVVAAALLGAAGPAVAVERPGDDGPLPAADLAPPVRVTLDRPCRTTSSSQPGPGAVPAWQRTSYLSAAWRHGRGEGQRVAVIDTGVNPGPRLPTVRGIGDLVAGRAGTDDCDAHGTLVAGVLAGAPDPVSGSSGVAPGAEVLSLRQTSTVLRPERAPGGAADEAEAPTGAVGTLSSLATAVRVAADAGATVITVAEVACLDAGVTPADRALGAALRYAVLERDVVVVAAAGNVDTRCRNQNPDRPDASTPGDDGWSAVSTIAVPAWFDTEVLAVGAVDAAGAPAAFSLHGPWLDVAAPGTGVVSVGADGAGTATATVDSDGSTTPIAGTSFAAPYVAGVAALVRQAFPALTAREVMERLRRTSLPAAGGADFVSGHGVVDPVAAVDAVVGFRPEGAAQLALSGPVAPTGRRYPAGVLAGAGLVAAAVVVVAGVASARLVATLSGRRARYRA